MDTPLLQTKLYIPPPRPELVPRPRLIERLNAGLWRNGLTGLGPAHKLTLISAPAGFGKTTLVSEWVANLRLGVMGQATATDGIASPIAIAWLSLDESDNDLTRFLTYLIGALQTVEADIGKGVLSALQSPQPSPTEAILTVLINETSAVTDRIVLVLDDYHLIEARSIHDALTFLLRRLPPQMHLVIATREDPPLSLARLRARGQLTELRGADLRFTSSEAAAFLNQVMGLDLSEEDIVALESRTEGWIAGLQLAAISMQGREDVTGFIQSFAGSHHYVLDYLVEEVLEQQSESVRTFLLQTAILDRLTGSLCDALTGQNTGRATLEMLEHANLFLIPLDDEHRWYRYHHLFADFLGQRLREKETDSIPELHRRASQWFEVEGSMDDAIQHALAAKDMERAARLVDQIAASLIVRRNPNALLKWIGRLPPDLCQGYPMLCVWRAWALYFARQLDAVEPLLQTAEANRDKVPHLPIPGYATTVRAYLANERGDLPRAIALSQQALEEMADAPPGRDTLIHQGAAVIGLGINYRHLGDLDRARQLFVQATSLNLKAGNIYAALGTKAQLGHLAMSRGQLHHAVEHYRRGLQMVQEWADQEGKGRGAVLAASELHLSLGTVLYQWNDLAGAAPHLQRAVELCELGEDWWRLYSYRMLAYLKQAEGETEAAYDLMQRSCAIRDTLSVRQVMNYTTEPGLEQLRISLSRARPEMAHLLADVARRFETQGLLPDDDIDFCSAAGYLQESEYADLARALIALARAGEAVPLLERLLAAAQLVGRHGATIYYLTLLALAFHALGDTPAALAHLCQALTLAEPEGYVRIFVDEGPPMARLLYEALSREIAPDYVRRLLAAFPITEPEQTDVSKILATNSELIEPLSDRELEVLRLFAEGLTNREIASRLFLAVNTVKAHAGNIYGKLNVHSRTQAIARAQALGLFPPK